MQGIKSKVKSQKSKPGFTLVELLVSMAVVAILASSLALVNISKNLARARDNRRQTDLEMLRSALEQYRYDNGKYVTLTGDASGLSVLTSGGYMGSLPDDPQPTNFYRYVSITTTPGAYQLCSKLENVTTTPVPNACGSGGLCGPSGQICNYQVVNP